MMTLNRLYETLKRALNHIFDQEAINFVIDAVRFICEANYFQYGSQVYKQLDGIAMGNNVSVISANLYMMDFDEARTPISLLWPLH